MSVKEQQIHEGIILYTETLSPKEIQMSILNEMVKVLSFTLDLTGSEGLCIKETGSLQNTVEIPPRSRVVIGTLQLEVNWKLSTKFRFASKPPHPEIAQALIRKDNKRLEKKIARAKKELRHVDFNTFDPAMISSKLGNFIDPYFPPVSNSINLGTNRPIEGVIQWRRPVEFFSGDFKVFDHIEPNDIKQGKLGDCWFMCALASLAERPELVERLFVSSEKSPQGFYQVRFCKSGEWVRVTVDDYFPCFPKDSPIFSRSHGNELWVLLLEKAYAKLHGSYSLLRGGWAAEGMMDLTGCPTLNIDFTTDEGLTMLANDEVWPMIRNYDDSGALISGSTTGEDTLSEAQNPQKKGGLVPGHAYTIITATEVLGNRIINIRNPWGNFEWDGDWSDKSNLWTEEIKSIIHPVLEDNDGTFWMSYSDFIKNFNGINICQVDSYEEARIKGVFERKLLNRYEWVVSKSYYLVQAKQPTKIIIGLHQEDARNYGVDERRPYLDLGIVVLDVFEGGFKLFKSKEAVSERQIEIEIEIEPDKPYLIWPRTSGCALSRPVDSHPNTPRWFENGELDPLFESTIRDLFRKANKILGEDLTYPEFCTLMNRVKRQYTEAEFLAIVERLPSHENGLTAEGFIEFIREACMEVGEATMQSWFAIWGYDEDLYSIESRCFILTLHSTKKLKIQIKSAEGLDLNEKIHEILIQKYGEKKGSTENVQLYCLMERAANAFTYAAFNDNHYRVRAILDCSNSEGLVFSGRVNSVECVVEPKQWKVITHCQISKTASACKLRPNLMVARV